MKKLLILLLFPIIVNGQARLGRTEYEIRADFADKTAEHWQTDDKGRKYLPIIINLNKEPDQYGNTHAIVLDTWKPDTQQAPVSKSKTEVIRLPTITSYLVA